MAIERRTKSEYQRLIIKKIQNYKKNTTLPMPIKLLIDRMGYGKTWMSRILRTMIEEGLLHKPDRGSIDLPVDR